MAPKPLPPVGLLRKFLRYEPETGRLFWLPREASDFADGVQSASHKCGRWNSQWAGVEAFTSIDSKGYRYGSIHNEKMRAHRVIWKMVHGTEPPEIDHRNGVKTDNALKNLRRATRASNSRNMSRRQDRTEGTTGVRLHSKQGTWQAYITVCGRQLHLGVFQTEEEAISARLAAERQHGFSEDHGRRRHAV